MSNALKTPAQVLTLGLAGLCVLLLLVLGGQRLFAGGDGNTVIHVAPNERARVGSLQTGGFELPPLGQFQAIVQRPLFNETRRPVSYDDGARQEPQVAKAAKPKELPPVTLTGVIITPQARFAMIRNTKDNEYYALKEGAPLEGWTLQSIGPRRVVFSSGSGEQVVELEVYTAGGGGAPRANQAQPTQAQSAAEIIRQRIERERERRRALIEAARKQQQKGDG